MIGQHTAIEADFSSRSIVQPNLRVCAFRLAVAVGGFRLAFGTDIPFSVSSTDVVRVITMLTLDRSPSMTIMAFYV